LRCRASAVALLLGEAVLVAGCLSRLDGSHGSRAAAATVGVEAVVAHAIREPVSDIPPVSLREVRLGHGRDTGGKVPPSLAASRFLPGEPIYLSMWEATEPAASAVIRVSILDATDRIVWRQEKAAPAREAYLSFDIGRGLAVGKYRVGVIADPGVAREIPFEVVARSSGIHQR